MCFLSPIRSAESFNNNLRSTEVEDDDEAGVQQEMNVDGVDAGVTQSWCCFFSLAVTELWLIATNGEMKPIS